METSHTMENGVTTLSSLDEQSLCLITGFLPVECILRLYLSGDASFRRKSLNGAVKSLNFVSPDPMSYGGVVWYAGPQLLPRLVTLKESRSVLWRSVPMPMWNQITSLTVFLSPSMARKVNDHIEMELSTYQQPNSARTNTMKDCFFPTLDILPSSLTSLNWTFSWSFLTVLGDEKSSQMQLGGQNETDVAKTLFHNHPSLADRLPNLIHLSIAHPDLESESSDVRKLVAGNNSFKILPSFPALFRTHPNEFIIPQLPQNLVSLRLPIQTSPMRDDDKLFGSDGLLSQLPSTLTELSLIDDYIMSQYREGVYYLGSNKQTFLTQRHFETTLPASITDLRLVPFTYDSKDNYGVEHFGWSYMTLRRLELYCVTYGSSQNLPSTLTHLTTYEYTTSPAPSEGDDYKTIGRLSWPPSLTSMRSNFFKRRCDHFVPLPPTLTSLNSSDRSLRVPGDWTEVWPHPMVIAQPPTKEKLRPTSLHPSYFPNLQVVELEFRIDEHMLLDIGRDRKIKLIVPDVHLTGVSLPPDMEYLDKLEPLATAFWEYWSSSKGLVLQLTNPYQLQCIQEAKFIFPPTVKSITLPGLSGITIAQIPASLTRWHHVLISKFEGYSSYPKHLTSLDMTPSYHISFSLRSIMSVFPNLSLIVGARLELDSGFIPPSPARSLATRSDASPIIQNQNVASSSNNDAKPTTGHRAKKSKDSSQPSKLFLPKDAIACISVLYPGLVIKKCHVHGHSLLDELEQFPDGWSHITLKGHFTVDLQFLEHGFSHCNDIISLNFNETMFVGIPGELANNPLYTIGSNLLLPKLPPLLQELSLGPSFAKHVLRGPHAAPNQQNEKDEGWDAPWLPPTLTTLRLTTEESYSSVPWYFPKMPQLHFLTITLTNMNFISPESITTLPPGLEVDKKASNRKLLVAKGRGFSEDTKCNVM